MIVVEDPGPLALLQDRGRPGHRHLGVSPSGPADRGSHALANRLVRNPEASTAIELVLGGFAAVAEVDLELAVCGTDSDVTVDGRVHATHTPITVRAGERIRIGEPAHGLRNYLAIRGALLADAELGSTSTDVMSQIGPAPLAAGDRIASAAVAVRGVSVDEAPVSVVGGTLEVALGPGPHAHLFTAELDDVIDTATFVVGPHSDRVGVRLTGDPVPRKAGAELRSEAMVRGAVQVPGDGAPIVLLADFPVTGGYPVCGVVAPGDVDRLAQARPGTEVRFLRTRHLR